MDLKEEISKEMTRAMKEKEETKVSVLRMLMAAIKNREIELKRELKDDEVLQVLENQSKKRKESVEQYKKAGREDLAKKEEIELEIIKKYLPEKMSGEEIKKVVEEIVREEKPEGMKDFGKIMGKAMARLKGKADGEKVSEVVREVLKERDA